MKDEKAAEVLGAPAVLGVRTVYPISAEEIAVINKQFTYQPPKGDQRERYEEIGRLCRELALAICKMCPPSADRSAALRLVREARMTANASIACGE